MGLYNVDSENTFNLDLKRIETTVPDGRGNLTMYVGDIELFREQYAPAFVEFARNAEQVYGIFLDSGKVVISDTQNHSYLNLARQTEGYTGEVVGRFQIENRGKHSEFLGQPIFDFVFVSLDDLEDLNKAYEFLGIDRQSYRAAVTQIVEMNSNKTGGTLDDLNKLIQNTWQGLFNEQTKVILSHHGKILHNGAISSIDKQMLLSGIRIEESITGDFSPLAMVYDPLANRLMSGDGHDNATANLGYNHIGIKSLENWTPGNIAKIGVVDYVTHTIYIRGFLERDLEWLPKLARKLKEIGFDEDVVLSFHIHTRQGRGEELSTTIKEQLQLNL